LSSRSRSASSADRRLAEIDAVFAALDNAARRQILLILHFRGDRMTAGEIAERFSCSWPTTSRHLRKLESANLVAVERKGREWMYRLNRPRLRVASEWLRWFDAAPTATSAARRRVSRVRAVAAG
jgi:DNA-binding transcriptional ArsR family regulator